MFKIALLATAAFVAIATPAAARLNPNSLSANSLSANSLSANTNDRTAVRGNALGVGGIDGAKVMSIELAH